MKKKQKISFTIENTLDKKEYDIAVALLQTKDKIKEIYGRTSEIILLNHRLLTPLSKIKFEWYSKNNVAYSSEAEIRPQAFKRENDDRLLSGDDVQFTLEQLIKSKEVLKIYKPEALWDKLILEDKNTGEMYSIKRGEDSSDSLLINSVPRFKKINQKNLEIDVEHITQLLLWLCNNFYKVQDKPLNINIAIEKPSENYSLPAKFY